MSDGQAKEDKSKSYDTINIFRYYVVLLRFEEDELRRMDERRTLRQILTG